MSEFTERYTQYARIQGRTPEAQTSFDAAKRPAAPSLAFMLWVQNAWRVWLTNPGIGNLSLNERHERFDDWLASLAVGQL